MMDLLYLLLHAKPPLSLIEQLDLVQLLALLNVSFKRKSFSLSPSTSFVTGIPVHLETIEAISSAVTSSRNKRCFCIFIYLVFIHLKFFF